MKKERFVVILKEGSSFKDEGVRQLMKDTETGVTYLTWSTGYGAAITPLIGPDGKPLMDSLCLNDAEIE